MRRAPQFLRETHLIGRQCRELMLDRAQFPVLGSGPFIWVGYSVLRSPYRMVRLRSVHSHVVAPLSGHGRTLIEGRAVDWEPGQVLLAPVGQHHAFEIKGREPWTIAWVFFDDLESAPTLPGGSPTLVDADASDFAALVRLLVHEASGANQPAMLEALVTALTTAARRLAGNPREDARLWKVWSTVDEDLARDWRVPELARLAGVSEEHLRRLCQRALQRSPMDQVTQLRLRRAGTLLRATSAKLAEVARLVGYASEYSFSAAFRRWSGVSPGTYRAQRPAGKFAGV